MCKICEPIFGYGGLPHTEEMCAFRQGAYCSVCGPGTHYASYCPLKPKKISDKAKPIVSVEEPVETPPSILMSNTNEGYVEYLRQNGLDTSKKPQENRSRVEKHLAPRLKLVNPPVPKALCKVEDTICRIPHADNEGCLIRKKIIRTKKSVQRVEDEDKQE